MRNITSPAFLPTSIVPERLYNLLEGLMVEVRVTSNPYNLELDNLFQMAARVNKKRGFLFVSKLLGKHIPVHASLSLVSGAVLGCLYDSMILQQAGTVPVFELQNVFDHTEEADRLYEHLMNKKIKVVEPTLFIGFAETATALGHSMFDAFEGNISFLHTTREDIDYRESIISFEEEHSHAVSHRCYIENAAVFEEASRVVLVDDEITTGNTSLNIIKELHGRFGHRDFVVASLLDWRSKTDRERFMELELALGIQIRCVSLLEGQISVEGSPLTEHQNQWLPLEEKAGASTFQSHSAASFFEHLKPAGEAVNAIPYLKHSGRFGLNEEQRSDLEIEISQAAAYLSEQRTGQKVLCMGTGEFMYIPMRIAGLMGEGVSFQSTTRSPIHPLQREQYAVTSAYRFDAVDDPSVTNYMYNLTPGQYDEAFIFMERELEKELRISFEQALEQTGIPLIHLVYFS